MSVHIWLLRLGYKENILDERILISESFLVLEYLLYTKVISKFSLLFRAVSKRLNSSLDFGIKLNNIIFYSIFGFSTVVLMYYHIRYLVSWTFFSFNFHWFHLPKILSHYFVFFIVGWILLSSVSVDLVRFVHYGKVSMLMGIVTPLVL